GADIVFGGVLHDGTAVERATAVFDTQFAEHFGLREVGYGIAALGGQVGIVAAAADLCVGPACREVVSAGAGIDVADFGTPEGIVLDAGKTLPRRDPVIVVDLAEPGGELEVGI